MNRIPQVEARADESKQRDHRDQDASDASGAEARRYHGFDASQARTPMHPWTHTTSSNRSCRGSAKSGEATQN